MSEEVSTRESLKRVRDDDEDMEFIVVVIGFIMIVVGACYGQKYRLKEVTWNEHERALTRATWMNTLKNDRICREQLRLDIRCFNKLCHIFQTKGGLKTTRNVTVKEIVALFLHILAQDLKKHYSVITEIRTYTKFKWDEKKKMVVIPAEQLADWYTYCTEAPQAAAYQNKFIENWDDICVLFASDRATGEGAEQHEEAAAAMENENDNASTSETPSGESNKRLKRDRLADAVSSFAESFKEYVMSKSTRPTSQEIYKEVSSVLGISRHQVLRAVKRFVNGTLDEFDMLKNLPDDQKLDWIILCIDE